MTVFEPWEWEAVVRANQRELRYQRFVAYLRRLAHQGRAPKRALHFATKATRDAMDALRRGDVCRARVKDQQAQYR